MHIRSLKEKDADQMIEWMHDENVVRSLGKDFKNMTKSNCLEFIRNSLSNNEKEYNFAICDSDDIYMGTVSLKNVNLKHRNAEYAIAISSKAMGKGVSSFATKAILKFAFDELGLERVYLNVRNDNLRAINFYKKIGFKYEGEFRNHLKNNSGDDYFNLLWFSILKEEF